MKKVINVTGDSRFQQGIEYFNKREFFEAHEVWEDLWLSTYDESRAFFQGLIQWSLSLYHFSQGNMRGAKSLFETGENLLSSYGATFQGVDVTVLQKQMKECLSEILPYDLEDLAGREGGEGLLRFDLDLRKIPMILQETGNCDEGMEE